MLTIEHLKSARVHSRKGPAFAAAHIGGPIGHLGLSIAAGSGWAIMLVVPLFWVINVGVIACEERYLEHKFGDAYRAYKRRVRRWV